MVNDVSLESRWIELFDELRCLPTIKDWIAAPFLSVRATDDRTILYVGKATAKDWYRDDNVFGPPHPGDRRAMNARIKERHDCAKEFLENVAPTYNSGFWQFARQLGAEAAKKWDVPLRNPLQHITWTNICKIGILKGNPSGFLLKKQRDLAIETLRYEITTYNPRLIYFATWDYAWDMVKEVFGDSTDDEWDRSGDEEWIWCRPATDGLPVVILTGHPERKRTDLRKRWLSQVSELLAKEDDK